MPINPVDTLTDPDAVPGAVSLLTRRRLIQWLALGSVLGSAASLTGCTMMQAANLKAPEVQVRNVSLGRLDLSGLEMLVDLRLRNPNNIALPITGVEYNLMLQNIKVADGRQAESRILPALGETDVRLGLNLNLLASASQLVPMLLNPQSAPKALNYRVDGSVKLDWWYMPSIPFNRAGEVPLNSFIRR